MCKSIMQNCAFYENYLGCNTSCNTTPKMRTKNRITMRNIRLTASGLQNRVPKVRVLVPLPKHRFRRCFIMGVWLSWESACFACKRSGVRIPSSPPKPQFYAVFLLSEIYINYSVIHYL